ncbi:MAG: ATP-binding cassette domain-containing protein [Candidatus Latescibacteria bacterium]|nr:ATP-binding cassette domain-containing protein [Candidatus Latescibacterota bacterium]
MSLSGVAIRRPVATTMFFVGLGLLGVISLGRLPVELMPEVIYPEIYVSLNLRGASPEQIERELVIPVEQEVGQLEGVLEINSTAALGRGTVRVAYRPHADMKFAQLQVQSRMERLQPLLTEGSQISVQRFDNTALSASMMELQVLGQGDLNWLRDFAEEKIRPELEAVEGVASAQVLGGQLSAVEVIADPLMLQAHGLTMNQLGARLNSISQPRVYLGQAYSAGRALPVSLGGGYSDLRALQQAVVQPASGLRLEDIAQVRYGLQSRTDLSRVNGLPAVGLRLQQEDEANLIDVAAGVEAAIERLNRDVAGEGVELIITSSQADLMQEALGTMEQAALIGLLLALVVLFLFLRNARFVSVMLLAIPASLLVTFNLMYAGELSLNVLSLCGLALAIGMLTDNSIVVMESIFKHYERGLAPAQAAARGTSEVSRAVVASTATTVMVFLPVVFIQSDYQDILRQLALAIVFPLLASLLVALALVPTLAARTLGRAPIRRPGAGRVLDVYTVLLKTSLRHRLGVAGSVGLVLLATLVLAYFSILEQETVAEESQIALYVELPEGTTLEATDAVVREVEDVVAQVQGLERYVSSVQEGQGSVTALLLPRSERPGAVAVEELKQNLEEQLQTIEAGVVSFEATGGAGRGGGRGGGGRGQAGGFNLQGGAASEQALIKGFDLATLQMIAEDLSYRLEEVEDIDANSVRSDAQRSAPEAQVIPDALALFDRALEMGAVLTAIEDANPEGFQTRTAFARADGSEVPIEVRSTEDPEEIGPGLAQLDRVPVALNGGGFALLGEVARVRADEGRGSILRTDQARRLTVSYRFAAEVLDSQLLLEGARDHVRMLVQDMVLPEGYSIELTHPETDTVYYWMMGIAALLVYMVLASLFESLAVPLVVFGTLPAAVIGSCWALMLTGTGLTSQAGPMALLGLIVLIGIAVNNGIILIDAIGALRRRGYRRERAVLAASRSRVRPILMTSATTLLGILPLALEFGGDYEIWPPFAITVLGGLALSMVVTLVFVPVVYTGLDQVRGWLVEIGALGLGLATVVAVATGYAVQLRFDSIYWTGLAVAPTWGLVVAVVWGVLRVHRGRAEKRSQRAVRTLHVRTLTKVYGAAGRFGREWARFQRRADRLAAAGLEPVDRRELADSLVWKGPALALGIYLHTYFVDSLWLFLLSLATWALTGHLAFCLLVLGRVGRLGQAGARHGLALFWLGYIQWRLQLPSVTVALACSWVVFGVAGFLAGRVRSGQVRLDDKKRSWVSRRVYGAAAALPYIGVARPTFQALSGVDLSIDRGMFGLLGPNGAGKTTLMRILCQVLEPTSGSIALDGVNIRQLGSIRALIGYLPQHFGLYDHMTAYAYLEYRALLEGLREPVARRQRLEAVLEQVNLLDRRDDPIGSFSGGMRQRVGIAQTLLHLPQIIVVDEPTAGLDPVERIRFRNLLARISRERIVIFSTHIVEDISGSCSQLAVLDGGQVLYRGSPQDMRQQARGQVWEGVVAEGAFAALETRVRMIAHVRVPEGIRARYLAGADGADSGAQAVEPTLEDAYLYLLEQGRRSAC